ncbi:bifunctional phosphoglucose/phosphomannose isomerase [Chloroherpeton thalassium ATCC 35110]|uniref:Bifunctional phosphoglucose/phosphomannose isomerase n=1 Tax=Chloroherpeton thalassium (strain ATCC 35110 / GB-78) TaxID=517418 RepID=B3QXK7_CHLT3|nr:bifunctional phosphoglucose/phosphomannose isomerase [Chloroherpeton thalassium]ACF14922.1 bifunctional phosphoglucose/phosphomannose isomerase [Chloroherpeton thalassium ATCC 35110]
MSSQTVTEELISQIDSQDMRAKILNLYSQFETEFEVLNSSATLPDDIQNIVITGLGGSAIGGDLIRTYLSKELSIPVFINRNYFLPGFVSEKTLVIACSYSGNTEETISAYNDALFRNASIVCITSGGEIESKAKKNKQFVVKLPGGFPPRAAIGYSFKALIIVFEKFGFIESKAGDTAETADLLKKESERLSKVEDLDNQAIQLAAKTVGKLPLIYTADDFTSIVGVRWKGQICENAKILAYANVLPELNHNELVGWKLNQDLLKQIHVIMLHDQDDHARTQFRMEITKKVISDYTESVTEVYSKGHSLMARVFSLIILGDWVSYYLAILNKIDPSPIEVIDHLKQALGGFRKEQ